MEQLPAIPKTKILSLNKKLLRWHRENRRDFPWRDPKRTKYEILIAEMMLQKTRAENVVKTYLKFIVRYPGFQELSKAKESEIARFIKPLGLYNIRGRNLKKLGLLMEEHGGRIPKSRAELLKLPGVGNYVANAYLAVALNKRVPIVDTNIKRLYSRLFSIAPAKDPRRDKIVWDFCEMMLPKKKYKQFNWALLDFAAMVCKAKNPLHENCILRNLCDFYANLPTISK